MHTAFTEIAAFVVTFLYGSYFEWVFHRYMFHSPKLCFRTFKEHTLVHHQIYKGDETYHTHDDHPEKVAMDWWALAAMVGFHLPFFWLIEKLTGASIMVGAVAAIVVYYSLYESLHWMMHVPAAQRLLGRFRWFVFIDNHHHLHHKYMLSNLNVILPLADLTLGTMRVGEGRRYRLFGGRSRKSTSASEREKRAA